MVSSDHPTRSELIDRRLFLHQLSAFPFKTKTEPITPYDYGKKSGRQEEREKRTGEDAQREKRRKTREESQERLTKESGPACTYRPGHFFWETIRVRTQRQRSVSFLAFPKGTATPKARGSVGRLVRRRLFPFRSGSGTAFGLGDDWSSVPGPDRGVSMPGICTAGRDDGSGLRTESVWAMQTEAHRLKSEKSNTDFIRVILLNNRLSVQSSTPVRALRFTTYFRICSPSRSMVIS